MSRRGNPYDNARAESFMKTLKAEEVWLQRYRTLTRRAHRASSLMRSTTNAGCIRRQLKRLQANGLKILRAMEAGAEIAPGAIYLEVVEVEDGGSVKRMLLVDDRPVDDVG